MSDRSAGGDHQILTWRFVVELDPIDQEEVEQVPTTSEWGLLILTTLLAGAAFIRMRW